MASVMFSCLCVTADRPEFYDFLLWNFMKQEYRHKKELLIIDGSVNRYDWPEMDELRVVKVSSKLNIPQKRNIALNEARGERITWFDDDDWQDRRKLHTLDIYDYDIVGSPVGCFVNIETRKGKLFRWPPAAPNSLGVKIHVVPSYNEATLQGSHDNWVKTLFEQVPEERTILPVWLSHFGVAHNKNISNKKERWAHADIPVEDLVRNHGLDLIRWLH